MTERFYQTGVFFVPTGEERPPKRGEYYLGAAGEDVVLAIGDHQSAAKRIVVPEGPCCGGDRKGSTGCCESC